MIVINNKIAKEVIANAIASGRVNESSVPKAYLVQANVHLNRVYEACDLNMLRLPKYSEKEFAAAEAIHWLIAYLEKLKCSNIEQLLRDVAEYRKARPDYPKGQWPWR